MCHLVQFTGVTSILLQVFAVFCGVFLKVAGESGTGGKRGLVNVERRSDRQM